MKQTINHIFLLVFLLAFMPSWAQNNPLDRKVHFTVNNESVKNTLRIMGKTGNFKFSYNTEVINGDSLISCSFTDKSVQSCLDDMFKGSLRYKVSGDHIILLKNEQKKTKIETHIISGFVKDSKTKQYIQYVSIYDVDEKYSTVTNSKGYYRLVLPAERDYRGLSFCKEGYVDTVLVIKTIETTKINVELDKSIDISPAKFEPVELIVEDRPISNVLISKEVKLNAQNLDHVNEKRFAQFSFLPSVGTNLSKSGVIENNFSFNLLAGYTKSVKGVEIGSFVNIVKENVSGVQLGGFGNMVGGKMKGAQLGGFFSINSKGLKGAQVSGFFNTALDTVTGAQVSGFANILKGKMNGAQVTGFYNMTTENVDGLQLAGFANLSFKDVKLLQAAGFTNIGRNVNGVQMAGFANFSKGDVGGAQIAGFANFAKTVRFAQISGFMNIAYGEIKGVQISPFLNLAKDVKGFQTALFNVSDTVSGFTLGLLSYVNKGYHQFELSGDETFYANIHFKTGIKKFYNILGFGLDPTAIDTTETTVFKNWYAAYGFGTEITTRFRYFLNFDLTINQIIEDDYSFESFTTMLRFNLNNGFRLFKKSGISIGPSVNVLISNRKNSEELYESTIPPAYSRSETFDSFITYYWIGGRLAIRI
jgi:hypothetical protein